MEPILAARGLGKRYGARVVLHDVHFSIDRGTVSAIVGRSGSGKSTLFKLIAGLDRPSEGQLLVDGSDVTQLDDERMSEMRLRTVGLVFQGFNLLPDLTVLENVRLPLDLAGVRRSEATTRAGELLRLLGMEGHADHRPNLLSGGESQRVAIARALANRPSILLADEPTAALDRANAENVLAAFRDVNRSLGTTVLVVSHDPIVIERFPRRLEIVDGAIRETLTRAA